MKKCDACEEAFADALESALVSGELPLVEVPATVPAFPARQLFDAFQQSITPTLLGEWVLTAETPNPQYVDKFISFLRDERKEVRIEAAEAMRKFGKRYHLERFIRPLLNDEKWEVRGNAVILIKDLGSPFDIILLEPLLNDPNQQVQRLVDEAMDKLGTYIKYRKSKTGKIEVTHQQIKRLVRRWDEVYETKMSPERVYLESQRIIANRQQKLPLGPAGVGGKLRDAADPIDIIRLSRATDEDLDKLEWEEKKSEREYTRIVFDDNLAVVLRVSPISEELFALEAVIHKPISDKFVSDVKVTIIDESGECIREETTDKDDGWVNLGARKPGRYDIRFKHANVTKHIIVNLEEDKDV